MQCHLKKISISARKKWAIIAQTYSKLIPPNRPSFDDCKIYATNIAKILMNKKIAKVLILGSSPRIRDILNDSTLRRDIQIYCLDITPEMYYAMSLLIWIKNPKEKYIKGDWLNIPFKNNDFDLIIGDEVIANINLDKHEKLFQEVSRVLKKDGFWITRHDFYIEEELKKINMVDFLINQAKAIIKGELSMQQAANDALLIAFYTAYKKKNTFKIGDFKSFYIYLKNKATKSITNTKEKLALKELYKNFCYLYNFGKEVCWTIMSEDESEIELLKYFKVQTKQYSKDYLTVKFSPIYVLSPKK